MREQDLAQLVSLLDEVESIAGGLEYNVRLLGNLKEQSEATSVSLPSPWDVTKWVKELRKSVLKRAAWNWLKATYPGYPDKEFETALNRRVETMKEMGLSPRVHLEALIDEISKDAADVTQDNRVKVARSLAKKRDEPVHPGKNRIRVRFHLWGWGGKESARLSYDRRQELHCLAIYADQVLGEESPVDGLTLALEQAISDGEPAKKREIVGGAFTHVRCYKKGVMDLWLEDEEKARQMAEALHPRELVEVDPMAYADLDHHNWEVYRVNGVRNARFERCTACGLVRVNQSYSGRGHSLAAQMWAQNPARQQNRGVWTVRKNRHSYTSQVPQEQRDRYGTVVLEREDLFRDDGAGQSPRLPVSLKQQAATDAILERRK